MKLTWIVSAILLGTVISPAQTTTPRSSTPFEQSLIAKEKNLIEAKKKDDDEFFRQALAEDFTLVPVDGQLLSGKEAIDELGDSDLKELTPYDIAVVLLSKDAAIVTYNAIVGKAPQEDEGPPPRYQHFSSVWVKQGNVWKLKFQQATAMHWGDW
jgi:hypothetical protein